MNLQEIKSFLSEYLILCEKYKLSLGDSLYNSAGFEIAQIEDNRDTLDVVEDEDVILLIKKKDIQSAGDI